MSNKAVEISNIRRLISFCMSENEILIKKVTPYDRIRVEFLKKFSLPENASDETDIESQKSQLSSENDIDFKISNDSDIEKTEKSINVEQENINPQLPVINVQPDIVTPVDLPQKVLPPSDLPPKRPPPNVKVTVPFTPPTGVPQNQVILESKKMTLDQNVPNMMNSQNNPSKYVFYKNPNAFLPQHMFVYEPQMMFVPNQISPQFMSPQPVYTIPTYPIIQNNVIPPPQRRETIFSNPPEKIQTKKRMKENLKIDLGLSPEFNRLVKGLSIEKFKQIDRNC